MYLFGTGVWDGTWGRTGRFGWYGDRGLYGGRAWYGSRIHMYPGSRGWVCSQDGLVWVLGFPLFVLGMAGAGDIKMAGLIAASLGIRDGLTAVMAGLILGAVLALAKILHQGSICQRFSYLSAYIRRMVQTRKAEKYYCPDRDGYGCVIPFGACLYAGTLFAVLWRG